MIFASKGGSVCFHVTNTVRKEKICLKNATKCLLLFFLLPTTLRAQIVYNLAVTSLSNWSMALMGRIKEIEIYRRVHGSVSIILSWLWSWIIDEGEKIWENVTEPNFLQQRNFSSVFFNKLLSMPWKDFWNRK